MSEDTATKEPEAQLPDDTTPVPIGTAPASSADSELDELLKQFDEATNKPAEAEPVADNATEQVSRNELDNFLAGLDSERNRISELEGEISSLRAAELDRQSRADFEGFSKKLQASLGPNVDDQFARTNLLAPDHDAVAFAVREARTGDIPSPPVAWGRLSGRDFRERVLKEFGYDPGTSW